MQRKTLISLLSIALLAAMTLTPLAEAQRDEGRRDGGRRGDQDGQGRRGQFGRGFGGGRPGGFGGGGSSLLGLLRIDEVREEIKVTEDQQELVEILGDELREGRPEFPENFRDLSEEERQPFLDQMQKWNEEQVASAKDTLKAILEPAQYTRLNQIAIQQLGIAALLDPEVAAALMLSEEQQKQIEATREANDEARRAFFTEQFSGRDRGGFDREAVTEKMNELRQEGEKKMLAHLSADQQTAFAALKGAEFEMPERQFRGGRGGRGGGGPGGGDRGRPGRPGDDGDGDRPRRPE